MQAVVATLCKAFHGIPVFDWQFRLAGRPVAAGCLGQQRGQCQHPGYRRLSVAQQAVADSAGGRATVEREANEKGVALELEAV